MILIPVLTAGPEMPVVQFVFFCFSIEQFREKAFLLLVMVLIVTMLAMMLKITFSGLPLRQL